MIHTDSRNPEMVYQDNIGLYEGDLKNLNKRHMTLGVVKLVFIVIGILALFRVFTSSIAGSLAILAGCFLMFIMVAFFHETVIRKIKHFKTLIQINQKELEFLAHRFPKGTDWGEEFKDIQHRYSSDLDLFEEKGVFHFVNRGVTAMGKGALAKRFTKPLDPAEVKRQQEAVMELTEKVKLRQDTEANGMKMGDSSRKLEALYQFLKEDYILKERKGLVVFLYVWPVLTLAAALAIAFGVTWLVLAGFAMVQVGVNKSFFKRVKELYLLTSKSHTVLKGYSGIMEELENGEFQSEAMKELQQQLSGHLEKGGRKKASACIGKLSSLLEWFDTRKSMIHFLLNNTVFWDLHCLYRIEQWRSYTARFVKGWFDSIGEFEAISSLATLQFNHFDWTMPELIEGDFRLQAKQVGHLLIPPGERVCNDVDLTPLGNDKDNGSLMVVTGPNMAGKSTFLRTIGVNIVLALAGGPVCADVFRVSWVKLFSSMKSSDSLDKHMSLFYAELSRLKVIIDGIASGEPVFFLIDEMLKGTNALDRQKGAIALLKQLIRNHANGIVATHDLELTKLTAVNFHFDGYVEEDKLLFDFLLKPGTCQSFNALALMKKMGIQL